MIRDGRLVRAPFLDIAARISAGGERGLLGLAFAPTFAIDGRFFVDYTDRDGNTVVSEFRAPSPGGRPGGSRLRAGPPPDRPAVREPQRRRPGDRTRRAPLDRDRGRRLGRRPARQRPAPRHAPGQALRIDPRPAAGAPYGIPADNPFVGRGRRPGGDLGLRPAQPVALLVRPGQRRPLDRRRRPGRDRGGGPLAESVRPAGPNFGWNTMEASACFDPAEGCDRDGAGPAGRRVRPRPGLLDHRRLRLPGSRPSPGWLARTSTPTTAPGRSGASRPPPSGPRRACSSSRACPSPPSARTRPASCTWSTSAGGRLLRVVEAG